MIKKNRLNLKSVKTVRVTQSKFLDERLLQKALPEELAPSSPQNLL